VQILKRQYAIFYDVKFTVNIQGINLISININVTIITKKTLRLLRWHRELTTKKTSLLSQPIVAIKNKQFFLLLSFPSNNLETDHKENTSRGVYRVFPSGFTISIYYFNTLYFERLWYRT
jgi:hypothetical protein